MPASALVSRLTRRWRKHSCNITEHDPTFKTTYLGNTVTQWAKGSGSVDKPLATLWRNYCQSTKPDIEMRLTIAASGLKATTREHGLTEYWSHRVTFVHAHPSYPKLLCWVYRHEGRKMKPELRCHAVLCSSEAKAQLIQKLLTERIHQALVDFRKEKLMRQNARLSVVSVLYPSTPHRKMVLSDGGANYRPPFERSRSAPKLSSIEEDREGERRAEYEDARRKATESGKPPVPPRPRALSEPLVPLPAVSIDPAAGVSDSEATSDTDCDAGSETSVTSGVSVPSEHTGDSDTETPSPSCPHHHHHHQRHGSPPRRLPPTPPPRPDRDKATSLLHLRSTAEDSDDSASDESGYAEEMARAE